MGINQLNTLLFHTMLIHFSYGHDPLQTVKRITKKPSTYEFT